MTTSTRGLDFATLSLKDALDLAILVEDEAHERYLEFTHQMEQHRTPEAAEFFRFMAGNEAKHGQELRAKREVLFPGETTAVSRAMLFDVEAPDYDATRASMSARQAMEVAFAAEEKAHAFFESALPAIADPDVRTLFEELRDEEVHHMDLVRGQIAKLPPGREPDGSDYEDEPVAQ